MAKLKTVTRSAKLGPEERAAAIEALKAKELDILVVGGGIVGTGSALDAVTRGLQRRHGRGAGLGVSGTSQPVVEARARRHPLPRAARLPAGARGAHRARAAAAAHRPAPGQAGALPLPADEAGLRAPLHRRRHAALRHLQLHRRSPARRAAPPPPDQAAGAARDPEPAPTTPSIGGITYYDAQVDDARYVANLARTASFYGAHVASRVRVEGFLKVGERVVGVQAHDLETGERFEIRAKQVVNATGVWTDDTQAMVGERGQFKVRASKGIHLVVPRDRFQSKHRAAAAHREERAVRHPVGSALADRHDRHRLEPRQGAPGRDRGRHRLPARARQQGARRAAHPRRRRGRLRRAAPAAGRRERRDLEALAASTSSRTPCPGSSSSPAASGPPTASWRRTRSTRPSPRSTARSRRASPRTSRCSAPRATRPRGTSARKIARAFGVHKVRIEHLLNRYGVLTDELLDLIRERPELRRAAARRRRLPRGRGRLRGDARGRAAPRGRARPPHPHLDRGLGPRGLGRPRRRPR